MSRRRVLPVLIALLVSGCAASPATPGAVDAPPGSTTAVATSAPPAGAPSMAVASTAAPQLPRGGTQLFPRYRLAGWCGYPGIPGQGRLGIGPLEERVDEMEERIKPFAGGREVMPVMELIAVTVQGVPGPDGLYRSRTSPAIIDEWLETARRHRAMLLLNVQPGRSDFLTEAKSLEPWLSQPDVGLALDPEWAMPPGKVPGRSFGRTTGQELDQVSQYLADLVAQHRLPEKVMLYHQLHADIVSDEHALRERPGVVLVKSVDGIGSPEEKTDTWQQVMARTPEHVHAGFKLFYEEDVQASGVLMTPAEVMALSPAAEYVLYE